MGHLAFVGSHTRQRRLGAAHRLMRKTVFRDLHALYPERIVNKTNGITFRRWLHQAIRGLTRAARRRDRARRSRRPGGARGARAARRRRRLPATASPRSSARTRRAGRAMIAEQHRRARRPRRAVRRADQAHPRIQAPAAQRARQPSRSIDAIRAQPMRDWAPRVKIFAGKAAASYHQAKLIIKLANDVAQRRQPRSGGARPAEGRVPAELQRRASPRRSFPRPICPSRSRPPAWRPPAPAT